MADFNAELQQFAMNTRSAPERIIPGHFADKLSEGLGYFRSSESARSALPPPVVSKSLFMPVDDRFRPNESQWYLPVSPDSRENDPKKPISILEARLLSMSL